MNFQKISMITLLTLLSYNLHASTWAKIDPNSIRGHTDQTINHIFEPYKHTEAMKVEILSFKSAYIPAIVNEVMKYQFKSESEAKEYADTLTRTQAINFYLRLLAIRANQHIKEVNEQGSQKLENDFRLTNHLKKLDTMFDIPYSK